MNGSIARSLRQGIASRVSAIALAVAAPIVLADDTEDLARKAADPTASLMSLNLR